MPILDQTDARSLLADFDAAQQAFLQAFSAVPDAALAYRPEGDDYAISGLLIHVAGVLEHYAHVLDELVRADFGPVDIDGAPDAHDLTLVRDGISPADRDSTLARMQSGHARLTQGVQTLSASDLQHKAPVRYGADVEPFPTSAVDILGWTRDHYYEHVSRIGELLDRWRGA